MSTLLLENCGAGLRSLGRLLQGSLAFALTNGTAIDENNKTIWRGDEREEL
jgi:hypothetical protein